MYSCIGATAFALVLSIRAASGGGSGRFFDEEVIASIDGVVGAGNYSRYTFSEKENSRLVLTTIAGDADLYVSDIHSEPTFDFENHELSSITCGLDTVDLPPSLKRPVNIAVYGHPRYEGSRFRLEVIYKGEEYDPFLIMNDDGEKAKETRKAKERHREQSHHAESDEEYDYEGSLTMTIFSILKQVLIILLDVLV